MTGESYSNSVIEPVVPGWFLPEGWVEEVSQVIGNLGNENSSLSSRTKQTSSSGLRTSGIFTFNYRSEGEGLAPLVSLREEIATRRTLSSAFGLIVKYPQDKLEVFA